ncbi:MAG: HD domain-containing protein [Raoultibacter sp.]
MAQHAPHKHQQDGNPETPVQANDVMRMVQRALNRVDVRLVDHGNRVAYLVDAMLEVEGNLSEDNRRSAYFITLFHDIGIYHTEEIKKVLTLESVNLWEHSLYGYLFLRELPFLHDGAEAILFHHLRYDLFDIQNPATAHLAQVIHVADRADVFLFGNKDAPLKDLKKYFTENSGTLFAPDAVGLFLKAQSRYNLDAHIRDGLDATEFVNTYAIPKQEAESCLRMLINAIDFRSHHTVTHTYTTAQISYQLAILMNMTRPEQEQIYHAALLHDLGKIGIPLGILEKPGKLTPAERIIMETHVDITEEIIEGCVDDYLAAIALRHHEKLDGSGYPRHLDASQLSLAQRLVAIADMVSALSGKRSYKEAFSKERVLAIVVEMKDAHEIDADICMCLEEHYDAIMADVARVCAPVLAAHDRILADYAHLLPQLEAYSERTPT